MNKRCKYLLVVVMLITSCNKNMLDNSSESLLKTLTESDSVTVYLKGPDLYIDLLKSRIDKNKRKLFYTIIAKEAYDIANQTRPIIGAEGKHIVRFVNQNNYELYEIDNRTLFLAEDIFNNLKQLLQSVANQDKKGILSYIEDRDLTSSGVNDLITSLTEIKLTEGNNKLNSYGFKLDNNLFQVYMTFVSKSSVNNFRFDFDTSTKKLDNFVIL